MDRMSKPALGLPRLRRPDDRDGSNATGRLPIDRLRSPLWSENRPDPKPNPVAHASRLCNRAEEYEHAGSSECCPRAQASTVEQGKADRSKTAAAPQTRLVDPDETPDRTPRPRSGHVQSGNRQQASRL